jgi:hypothetical protein
VQWKSEIYIRGSGYKATTGVEMQYLRKKITKRAGIDTNLSKMAGFD